MPLETQFSALSLSLSLVCIRKEKWNHKWLLIIYDIYLSSQVTKAYNYIHKYGHKSKLMAAAIRNKQDVFNLLG